MDDEDRRDGERTNRSSSGESDGVGGDDDRRISDEQSSRNNRPMSDDRSSRDDRRIGGDENGPSDGTDAPSRRIESPSRGPQPADDDEALDPARLRLLVIGSVLGSLLFLVLIGGIAAVSEFSGAPSADGPPDASFTIRGESTEGSFAANITHRGGQAANPDELVIEVDEQRRGTWTELGGDGASIVGTGHSLVLDDVEPGQEIRLLWIAEDSPDREPVELHRATVQTDET